jgi:hypothetical protein
MPRLGKFAGRWTTAPDVFVNVTADWDGAIWLLFLERSEIGHGLVMTSGHILSSVGQNGTR